MLVHNCNMCGGSSYIAISEEYRGWYWYCDTCRSMVMVQSGGVNNSVHYEYVVTMIDYVKGLHRRQTHSPSMWKQQCPPRCITFVFSHQRFVVDPRSVYETTNVQALIKCSHSSIIFPSNDQNLFQRFSSLLIKVACHILQAVITSPSNTISLITSTEANSNRKSISSDIPTVTILPLYSNSKSNWVASMSKPEEKAPAWTNRVRIGW